MANTKFTTRLRTAFEMLHANAGFGLIPCRSGCLFSPVFRSRKYTWAKIMDSDGLLVTRRAVHDGEGRCPSVPVTLLMGVVVQSEDTTSQTKPNPMGKASLSHVPNGVWVDLDGASADTTGRHRLDRVLVVFVLPKGAAAEHRAKFETAKWNVQNAAILMPDAVSLEVARNTSSRELATRLSDLTRPFLKGAGRPRRG
jgi:hypothetical protein